MIKIAVLVSGGGSNLQAILDYKAAGHIPNGEVCLVISSKQGAYALQRAKNHQIDTLVIERRQFSKNEDFCAALKGALQAYQIDLIVLAGFMCILTKEFTDFYAGRIINVHPSLIPSFCGEGYYGLRVHQAALDYGVKVTGATVHFVNEITDGGKILLQRAVEVQEGDTPETLQKRVMEQAEWILLPQAVEMLSDTMEQTKKAGERK